MQIKSWRQIEKQKNGSLSCSFQVLFSSSLGWCFNYTLLIYPQNKQCVFDKNCNRRVGQVQFAYDRRILGFAISSRCYCLNNFQFLRHANIYIYIYIYTNWLMQKLLFLYKVPIGKLFSQCFRRNLFSFGFRSSFSDKMQQFRDPGTCIHHRTCALSVCPLKERTGALAPARGSTSNLFPAHWFAPSLLRTSDQVDALTQGRRQEGVPSEWGGQSDLRNIVVVGQKLT